MASVRRARIPSSRRSSEPCCEFSWARLTGSPEGEGRAPGFGAAGAAEARGGGLGGGLGAAVAAGAAATAVWVPDGAGRCAR